MGHRFSESSGSVYLWAVPALGVAVLLSCLKSVLQVPPGAGWLLLTALTSLVSTFTIRIPGSVVRFSVSETLVFLATLTYGPPAGTITAGLEALVMSLRLRPELRTAHRLLFNIGALSLAVWPAAHLFFYLADLSATEPRYDEVGGFVGPLYIFAAVVFLLNSSLVAIAVAIDKGISAIRVWRSQFQSFSASYLASAAIAAILLALANAHDYALVALLLPLVIVLILTVRTTLGRLSDEHQHLTKVNQLYLATIETLAMAIDAKDQVTHGHIRRVQRIAVRLANALGITEDQQIRAIEAAALLHDMGKLAIPEFILNKPGKLTPHEFSIMKTHAAVGADLLSSIQFPYPVVPIVRHHHEHWNGSGYPDGLAGADIPIGARILAVVDCYDALTSHRPYRPAMAPAQALQILSQRRGQMYDPLVVDAFMEVHSALSADSELEHLPAALLAGQPEQASSGKIEPSLAQDSPVESLRVLACLAPFPDGLPAHLVCRQTLQSLRTVVPFDTAVVYGVDDSGSVLAAIVADGPAAQAVSSLRIPVAERLSGWVAAYRTSVWNSDAALDLAVGDVWPGLALASSLPLCVEGSVIGVLTLYGRPEHEVSVGQRHTLESLLSSVAVVVDGALARPAISIDCRLEGIRQAALSALDSLLSHGRYAGPPGPGAVVALSLAAVHGEPIQIQNTEPAADLARKLSPWRNSQRCILVLAADQLLVCALDGASAAELVEEVTNACAAESAAAGTVACVPIRTSLELQDRVRRVQESVAARRQTPERAHRVH